MIVLRRFPTRLASKSIRPTQWRTNSTSTTTTSGSNVDATPPISTPVSGAKKFLLKGGPGARVVKGSGVDGRAPVQSQKTEEVTPAASQTQGRKRRKPIPTRRPPISLAQPKIWNRPIREGVIPAYDLALEVIRADSLRLKEEARVLKKEIHEKEAQEGMNGNQESEEALEVMREKLHILEVQSEVNFPNVRWSVANAMVDMTKPAHRHLVEQKWRKDGDLDLLMERIYQMKVVPDVLPQFHPTVDLHVTSRALPKDFHETKKVDKEIEPGSFLTPEQTRKPPKLYANVFHTDTRLYTLLLVDPDVPDEQNKSFKTFLHWLCPNIPLSATNITRIPELNIHTRYIPPHPQCGTPYHRYVLLLLPQPPISGSTYTHNTTARSQPGKPTSMQLDIPIIADEERHGFDVRSFIRHWGLDVVKGGGIHMWREEWHWYVSRIYEDILGIAEPRYGRPQKKDPYAEIKQTRRYIL